MDKSSKASRSEKTKVLLNLSNVEFDVLDGMAAMIGLLFALEAPTDIASDRLHVFALVISAVACVQLLILESISNEKYRAFRITSALAVLVFRIVAFVINLNKQTVSDSSLATWFLVGSDASLVVLLSLVTASVRYKPVLWFVLFALVLLIGTDIVMFIDTTYERDTAYTKSLRISSGILIGLSILLLGGVRH